MRNDGEGSFEDTLSTAQRGVLFSVTIVPYLKLQEGYE